MPRASAEERAAAFYRAGNKAPAAPKALSSRAQAVWRQIVSSKPVDWFDPSHHGYLADHCETWARLEEVWAGLRQVHPGSDESRILMNALKILRGNFSVSSRHLRLTVHEAVDRKAAKATEQQAAATGNELIGGGATRLKKVA
jgi:phage terminase small subunit